VWAQLGAEREAKQVSPKDILRPNVASLTTLGARILSNEHC
jgi:hypothetical protein